jgi:hypothetical protein
LAKQQIYTFGQVQIMLFGVPTISWELAAAAAAKNLDHAIHITTQPFTRQK